MFKDLLYQAYERRLTRELDKQRMPRHVGVILDGNRRWAKTLGVTAAHGHRRGASKIREFLTWCEETNIELVTLWLLSTDNLERSSDELKSLLDIIVATVESLARAGRWRLHLVGDPSVIDEKHRADIAAAVEQTRDNEGLLVNVAIGYGGRNEILGAIREFIASQAEAGKTPREIADAVCAEEIEAHLYTRGQPDPDLVIRTSGEQRLSGFMPWQTVHSEYYFCEAYWPDFRRTDFLRALRDYAQRDRRHGR
ncbi:MAG: isoprenyl transferase [Flaviflexus sp.]|nr:isoprenyl transferase [Flaviflexus sp.]